MKPSAEKSQLIQSKWLFMEFHSNCPGTAAMLFF
jgi:hypothetical protein